MPFEPKALQQLEAVGHFNRQFLWEVQPALVERRGYVVDEFSEVVILVVFLSRAVHCEREKPVAVVKYGGGIDDFVCIIVN